MRMTLSIVSLFFIFNSACTAKEKVLYEEVLHSDVNWIIEQQPGGTVTFKNNKMKVTDAQGCTVWFKEKLNGNIKITYDITIIDEGESNDRVSDMNCFWMANDPKNPDDFFKESTNRAGHFPNYHHLKLYYVGYGGHNNTKTRFRRYNGNINRPLLPEHDLSDKNFMITPNKKMSIEIIVKDNYTSYIRDHEIIFTIYDAEPYHKGYFGFRTVNNRMEIENFKVLKID